jgi:hypothetical protein
MIHNQRSRSCEVGAVDFVLSEPQANLPRTEVTEVTECHDNGGNDEKVRVPLIE